MKKFLILCCLSSFIFVHAQKESISFENHGKTATLDAQNPFQKFVGEWALKDNDWSQNWGYGTETIKIPNHHTISSSINTKHSLISIVDGPEPNGHIFWTFNPVTKEVGHLSSFGDVRYGKGTGTVDENGNLRLKISFEGEAKGTYRIYKYTWKNEDEYALKSIQYNQDDEPTGLFYSGNFVRIEKDNLVTELENILKVLDNNSITVDEQLTVYADAVQHMAPNQELISNKADLKTYLEQQRSYGTSNMTHTILEYEDVGDTIILQGEVAGTFFRKDAETGTPFRTKNLFVLKRIDGVLKITKVIYNTSPNKK
jgi:hypothetical protein